MPFVNFAQDEEKDQEATQPAQPVVTLRGASGGQGLANQGPNTGASLTNTAQPANQSRSSGTFTNLNKYLDANRAGAANIGNRVATEVGNQASKATQDINQAGANFGRRVNEGTNQFNENLTNEAVNDATNFVNDPNKVSQLQKQKSGEFGGPTNFTGSDEANTALASKQKAEETAGLTGTVGGRQELIRNTNKANPYSQGGLSLNQFLVQNNSGALGKVLDSAQASKGLGGQLTNTQTTADQAVKTGQDISNQTGLKTNQQLTGAVTDFRGKLGQKAVAKTEAEQAEQTRIAQELGANTAQNRVSAFSGAAAPREFPNVSDETLSKIGLTREQFNQLQQLNSEVTGSGREGISLGNYLQNTPGQYTEGSVSSPQEQAYLSALQQLAGTNQQLNNGGFAGNSRFDLQSALNALLSQTGGGTFNPETGEVTSDAGQIVGGGVGGLTGIGTVAKIIKDLIDKQKAEKAAQEQAQKDAADRAEAERKLAEETAIQNNPLPNIPSPVIPAVGAGAGTLAGGAGGTPGGTTTITEGDGTLANQQPNQPAQNNLPQNNAPSGSVGGGGSGAGLGGALAGGVGAAAGTLAGAAPAGTVLITEGAGAIANQIANTAAQSLGTGAVGAANGAQAAAAGESALSGTSYAGAAKAVGNALAVVGAVYGAYSTYQAAKMGDTKSAIISGASTGAAIGSVVPGIGTVVGAAIGAIVGGIGSLFGSKPKASQVAYAAYKKLPPEANIRGFTVPQMSSGYFESFKAHKNSGKFPILNDLYSAFGVSQGDHKNASGKMLQFIEGVIETAQREGGIPDDNNIVRQLDGQQIYRILVAPALDAMVSQNLNKPGYDNWTTQDNYGRVFPGGFDQYSADAVDWIISQWGNNKTSTNNYAAGREYANPAYAPAPPPPPPAPAPAPYQSPSGQTYYFDPNQFNIPVAAAPSGGGGRITARQILD